MVAGAGQLAQQLDARVEEFAQKLLKLLVEANFPPQRLEIEITGLAGKWKASQNRVEADRHGVVEGLSARADGASHHMAALVAAGANIVAIADASTIDFRSAGSLFHCALLISSSPIETDSCSDGA